MWPFTPAAAGPAVGEPAPDFRLADQNGLTHSLQAQRGRWVVLYFYPKDDTPGCTAQACAFRDDFLELQALGARLLGVSLDDAGSHARFARKHGLPFPLLSDPRGEVAGAYGALLHLGPLRLARRHSFLIDPEGRIARIYRRVDPRRHSTRIIADLRALQGAGR